jgi:hypothetical protein
MAPTPGQRDHVVLGQWRLDPAVVAAPSRPTHHPDPVTRSHHPAVARPLSHPPLCLVQDRDLQVTFPVIPTPLVAILGVGNRIAQIRLTVLDLDPIRVRISPTLLGGPSCLPLRLSPPGSTHPCLLSVSRSLALDTSADQVTSCRQRPLAVGAGTIGHVDSLGRPRPGTVAAAAGVLIAILPSGWKGISHGCGTARRPP